jgi:outer membrane protein assembly factor BamB
MRRALYCSVVLIAAGLNLSAQEWTQWRGPSRNGQAPLTAPKTWPATLSAKWKVTVGEGYASPLMSGGRVLQFARQGDVEVAMALDPETGKIFWQQSYPASWTPVSSAAKHGKGPKSTPLVYDGRFYTFGATGILSAWNAASGKLEWRKEYATDFKATLPMFGTSMSPVAADGMIVVLVGTNGDGAIVAYDAKTGAQKWIWKGDGPAYGSPVVADIGGTKQVITLTEKLAVGLSLSNGDLLWTLDFPGRSGMNIPTPLPLGQRVLLAGDPGTLLVQPKKSGKGWTPEKVWQVNELTMRYSSPVRKGNLVFGFSNRNAGIFFCVDADSGKTLWTSDPRQGDTAVLYLAGDVLFLLKYNGELIVANATGEGFQPLHTYKVSDNLTYADPLIFDKGVIIKDNTSLQYLTWQ